jgi:hypothetical protein
MTEPMISSHAWDLAVMCGVFVSLIALAVCAGWEKYRE